MIGRILLTVVALGAWLSACVVLPQHTLADPARRHSHHHRVVVRQPVGHRVSTLPRGHTTLRVGGVAYHYHAGVFYRPRNGAFVVVAAPLGAVVATLPVGHVTLHIGGRPYYVYNETYYVWNDGPPGYVVVEKPEEATESVGVIAYPKEGQDPDVQARDRYECHAWAVRKSGFDPSQGLADSDGQRSTYDRAMQACLEGRAYSVQ
jgi:hypothetical protein